MNKLNPMQTNARNDAKPISARGGSGYFTVIRRALLGALACIPSVALRADRPVFGDAGGMVRESDVRTMSYMIGWSRAHEYKYDGITVSIPDFICGLKDGAAKTPSAVSEEDKRKADHMHDTALRKREAAFYEMIAKAGDEFIKKYSSQNDVKTGVRNIPYKSLRDGTGEPPKNGDVIRVLLHGYIPGFGTVDLAQKEEMPLKIEIGETTPLAGLNAILPQLLEGASLEFVLRPELAYGDKGYKTIPPRSTLLIQVERVKADNHSYKGNPYVDYPRRAANYISPGTTWSYLQGYGAGTEQYFPGITLMPDLYADGFSDAYDDRDCRYKPQEIDATREVMMQYMDDYLKVEAINNQKISRPEFEKIMKLEGIVTLPSGLCYKIIKKGSGRSPLKNDDVRISVDIKVITTKETIRLSDSNSGIRVGLMRGMCPGLLEGLLLMTVGSEYEFYIPDTLVDKGAFLGATVPLGSGLIVKVRLEEIIVDK
jgi:FKBP-type peptidyl-prolyl cis-trans isomerase FklB